MQIDIDLSFQNLTEIPALDKNTTNLNLACNQIVDISPLKEYTNLIYLSLMNNFISDLSVLKNLKNLRYLNLEYLDITDLNFLTELNELEFLDLRFARVKKSALSFSYSLPRYRERKLEIKHYLNGDHI